MTIKLRQQVIQTSKLQIQDSQMLPNAEYSFKQASFSVQMPFQELPEVEHTFQPFPHSWPHLAGTGDGTHGLTANCTKNCTQCPLTEPDAPETPFLSEKNGTKGQNQCLIPFGFGQFCRCTFNHTWQRFHFPATSQAVMEVNAPSRGRESKYEMSWLPW